MDEGTSYRSCSDAKRSWHDRTFDAMPDFPSPEEATPTFNDPGGENEKRSTTSTTSVASAGARVQSDGTFPSAARDLPVIRQSDRSSRFTSGTQKIHQAGHVFIYKAKSTRKSIRFIAGYRRGREIETFNQ